MSIMVTVKVVKVNVYRHSCQIQATVSVQNKHSQPGFEINSLKQKPTNKQGENCLPDIIYKLRPDKILSFKAT